MGMIMSTNYSHTASGWLNHAEMRDWTKRLGVTIQIALQAMDSGRAASHDYRLLAARGLAPQQATGKVFQKHFSKR